jgi:predicted nucleic acid-binding protein
MGVVLDTSALIEHDRGRFSLVGLRAELARETVGVAAITASELLVGAYRTRDPNRRVPQLARAEAMLADLAIHPFGYEEARRHAELWAYLASNGTPIGPHDALIAATALARGDSLATLNRAEFARVPGLRLLDLDRYRA